MRVVELSFMGGKFHINLVAFKRKPNEAKNVLRNLLGGEMVIQHNQSSIVNREKV
jgi:hypothetical protein